MTAFKTFTIKDDSDVVSGEKVYFSFTLKNMISTVWKMRDDNKAYSTTYGNGRYIINTNALRTHGDLMFSAGWTDGFYIRRLGRLDGVYQYMEDVYRDYYPLNGYSYYQSLALDKENCKAYVMSYGTDGLAVYDYSNIVVSPHYDDALTSLFQNDYHAAVPTYTNYDGGYKINFDAPSSEIFGIRVVVTLADPDGDIHVGLNSIDLGTMDYADYGLIDNATPTFVFDYNDMYNINTGASNEISIWSPSGDGGNIERVTIYKQYYGWENAPSYNYNDGIAKTTYAVASNGIPTNRVGYAYFCGLEMAGTYLYMGSYTPSWDSMKRWNTVTEETEEISVINFRKNGYRGYPIYDDINDRLFMCWEQDGGIWMVINASNEINDPDNPPKCYDLRTYDLSLYEDGDMMIVTPCKYNSNHLYLGYYAGRMVKIDIGDILSETETVPTVLDYDAVRGRVSNDYSPFWLTGNLPSDYNRYIPNNKLSYIGAYSESYGSYGWIDWENFMPVGIPDVNVYAFYEYKNYLYTYAWANEDILKFSYTTFPSLLENANGDKYWVISGYGFDGYNFRFYDENNHPYGLTLEEKGHIIFGTYELDGNENIGSVKLSDIANQVYEPTGCKLKCFISNDDGVSWEEYDYKSEEEHFFKSTGNKTKVKFDFYGNIYSAPHINSNHYINVTIIEKNKFSGQKRVQTNSLIG